MKHTITQEDKNLLLQGHLQYNYKLLVVDKNNNVADELSGLQAIGSYSIDSDSNIRRTCSFVMYLNNACRNDSIEQKLYEWVGCSFRLQIGLYRLRDSDFQWYECGYYLITEANTSYNAAENSITTSLSDWYARLNGIRNGQIGGAPTISIPNKDENGGIITVKQVTEDLLKSETGIKNYIIDDIGQFYGMPQNNPNYMQYREENPLWNQLPYDLEYEAGCTVGDIFSEVCGLYPNCQMYFDIYGNFCFNLIPSCEYEHITLDDSFIQQILTGDQSESVSYDVENIKNVTEVFGAAYDIDRYSKSCTASVNLYSVSLDNYTQYGHGDFIAFIPNTNNGADMKIRINSLASVPLYYENTENHIGEGILEAGKTYVIQIKRTDSAGAFAAYYLGQYQPHALCVLTDSENDPVYTKAYFAQKYNCHERNIVLRVEEGSPFAVQKIGEILDVKSGDVFDNIISDSSAVENAVYYNRKSSSVYDIVKIQTKMIPFLDVNEKVEYRKQQEGESHFYVVKSIVNNTDAKTSDITMYRFYPLYYL